MSTLGKHRTCRRCGQVTYDFDTETGVWWCGDCDEEADT